MLEALIVYSIIIGIRYLILANRPYEKYDDGDIQYINKLRAKKKFTSSIPEFQKKLKSMGIRLLILAGVLIVVYFVLIVAVVLVQLQQMPM